MLLLQVGEEIILKTLEIDESEILFHLVENNRLYLREWLPWVDTNATVEESKAFIHSAREQQEQNFGFQCGIWFRNQLVGVIGFHRIDWMNKNAEIGYWLGAQFQGKGIITKSCTSLIDYAFHVLKLHRVQLRCATENKKSCSVIERLGFQKEGITRQSEFLYDHYVDLCVYGMTDSEWNKRPSSSIREEI
jgi:ribosomal-protein-serine acetyltransferase